jgi:hypothetical protein
VTVESRLGDQDPLAREGAGGAGVAHRRIGS